MRKLNVHWTEANSVVGRKVPFRSIFFTFRIRSAIPLFVKRALQGGFGYTVTIVPDKDEVGMEF